MLDFWKKLEFFNYQRYALIRKKLRNCMNIIKWTIVVIAGIASVTIVAVSFLVTNSANTILAP